MLSPEIIAEQVMGYVVGASELIPTLKPTPEKPYSLAILPQGPHFYTGLLQAAGYLLLDGQKKKLLIISEQYDDLKNILIDTNTYGPVFGQIRKTSDIIIRTLARQLKAKLTLPEQMTVYENIRFQLPFIRVITETEECLHISIGPQTSQTIMENFLKWIKKHISDYNIVLLHNIELPSSTKSKKSDEQNQIAKLIQGSAPSNPLITVFQKILNFQKKKPEIIAYVNPGDSGKTGLSTTRYICAVG